MSNRKVGLSSQAYARVLEYNTNRRTRLRSERLCDSCGQRPRTQNTRCSECWTKEQARNKAYRNQLMRQVILMYGGKCICCNELRFEFLTLDHVNNDGFKERRERGYRGGYGFYKKLINIPLREDLQVMCYNCNLGKARCGGTCPHAWDKK